MKITDRIQYPAFDKKVNFRHYETDSKNCVIFCHGQGERGPADGSQISLVERNSGWPKFAKGVRPKSSTSTGTIEYPFNIIAPQIVSSYNTELNQWFPTWVRDKFRYDHIILAGISMGNYGIYDMMKYDIADVVRAFVACCGLQEINELTQTKKIPGIAWHGNKDSVVSHDSHKNFITQYNAAGGKVVWNTLDGVGHDAWNHAFKSNPAEDKSLQFVNNILSSLGTSQSAVDAKAVHNNAIDQSIASLTALKK